MYLTHHLARLLSSVDPPLQPLHILELGAGTGLVGASLSALLPYAKVTLTDLPDAQETLAQTVALNELRNDGLEDDDEDELPRFRNLPLEWTSDRSKMPAWVGESAWHIMVVTDCTYNPIYYNVLLDTMRYIAQHNPDVLILYASKRRHEAEVEFEEILTDEKSGLLVLKAWNEVVPGANGEDETIEYRSVASHSRKPAWVANVPAFSSFWR